MYNACFTTEESSLIEELNYFDETMILEVVFHDKYFVKSLTYEKVPLDYFIEFTQANSKGKFYLQMIKPFFSQQKTHKMADKVIKVKINVREINKDWIFAGQKGDYLNFTVLFNEEQDDYGNNGMVVQDVPTEVYKQDKKLKGPILGNCKVFGKGGAADREESEVGKETGKMGGASDDLPF